MLSGRSGHLGVYGVPSNWKRLVKQPDGAPQQGEQEERRGDIPEPCRRTAPSIGAVLQSSTTAVGRRYLTLTTLGLEQERRAPPETMLPQPTAA